MGRHPSRRRRHVFQSPDASLQALEQVGGGALCIDGEWLRLCYRAPGGQAGGKISGPAGEVGLGAPPVALAGPAQCRRQELVRSRKAAVPT